MDTGTTVNDVIEGKYKFQDGTSESFTLDATPVIQRLDYQNELLLFVNILLFSILIFIAFKLALKEFLK